MDKISEKNAFQEAIVVMLAKMGHKADSNVVAKLCEFSTKYLIDILEDAKYYSNYSERKNI